MARRWENAEQLRSRSYVCGYCSEPLASDKGYHATKPFQLGGGKVTRHSAGYIYICHHCENPTYFEDGGDQHPGPPFGGIVKYIPSDEVAALYDEARNCMKVNAYTAAVMCCRKLLMNVAVDLNAAEGGSYKGYIQYLSDNGHLTANMKKWVEPIKNKGNDANHEIRVMDRKDAEQIIKFSEMLLKITYEYPAEADATGEDNSEYPGVPPSPT